MWTRSTRMSVKAWHLPLRLAAGAYTAGMARTARGRHRALEQGMVEVTGGTPAPGPRTCHVPFAPGTDMPHSVTTTVPSRPHLRGHHHRVQLQRRIHETRRMLLEAADHLLDVDEAVRVDDTDGAKRSHQQAMAIASAAQHELAKLEPSIALTPVVF